MGGWHQHMEKMTFENGREYVSDDYTQLFYTNLGLRPSCGNCHFSNMNRQGDFTIGDYWGVEKHFPSFDDNTGVSLLFFNSSKSLEFEKEILENLQFIQIDEKQAVEQRNLITSTIIPKCNRWFWHDYNKYGIKFCMKYWSPTGSLVFKVKRRLLRMLRMWD